MAPHLHTRTVPRTVNLVLAAGFGAVISLSAVLAGVALNSMTAINARLDLIVHNHNVKKQVVETMYRSVQARIVSLQRMLLLDDAFERDAESVMLDELAGQFAAARQQLVAMELTPQERRVLAEQSDEAARAVPLQREVARLIMADRLAEAHTLLVQAAIPAQDRVLATLDNLDAIQERATRTAFDEALTTHRRARGDLILLAASAGLFATLIAISTIGRVRRAELQLSLEKERAEVTLRSIGDGVITTDAAGRVEAMNGAAEQLVGRRFAETRGRLLSDVLRLEDGVDGKPLAAGMDDLIRLSGAEARRSDAILRRPDGATVPVEHTLSSIDQDGQRTGLVVVFRDVSEHRAHAHQLRHAASHDPLTGLINRAEFERRVERCLQKARETGERHVLCFLDLDRFKAVNDTCGHAAGDELLRQLSERLRGRMRGDDTLARLGGDEFGVLLAGCPRERAIAIAEGLRDAVKGFAFVWGDKSFSVGVSIGLVPFGPDAGGLTDLLATADAACYAAKERGRDRLHVSERPDPEPAHANAPRQCVDKLRSALRDDRFILHAQTLAPLGGADKTAICEVLLRLDDGGEERLPMAFLPTAERYHLMPAIDLWVVEKTLQRLWQNPDDCVYSINLAAQSLRDTEFPERVEQALGRHGVDPRRLCFEVPETAAMANLSRFGELVRRLGRLGCRFAVDDFGSGIGSFSYLRGLAVDYVKIEGRLIQSVLADHRQRAVVESINRLSHVFGMSTVAKRVEDSATAAVLARMGTDFAQGFAVARPALI